MSEGYGRAECLVLAVIVHSDVQQPQRTFSDQMMQVTESVYMYATAGQASIWCTCKACREQST